MTLRAPSAAVGMGLTAAGCLSTPSYAPPTAVVATQDGTGTTVAAPGFALHFATGDGFHLPDRLEVDGNDVLGHDPMPACFDDNEVGFQIAPSDRISGDSGATVVKNELQPVLRGPAVVQMKLDWATQLGSTDRMPGGTSTFTVFLDGRIVRHDRLDDPHRTDVNATDCKCGPDARTEFSVASYWTFARPAVSALYAADPSSAELSRIEPPLPPEVSGVGVTCFDATTYQLATTARLAATETDPHLLSLRDNDALFTFAHFNTVGASSLDNFPWDSHTALIIERSNCATAFRRAHDYVAPPVLAINGTPVMPAENDGIYGGDTGDGRPGLALGSDRAELTGAVNGSFAVWLGFTHSVDLVRATLAGATGAWYVPQQVDGRTWILWFRDSLAAGQTIVIEPD